MHDEHKISAKIFELARNGQSVSSEFAKDPYRSSGDIASHLYGSHALKAAKPHPAPKHRYPATKEDLERARQCGKFEGTDPSELFLRAYHDALVCLEHDPLAGMVSPSLLGSTGVVPLISIGSLHDSTRHWSNIIARAKNEVLFATNAWKPGDATHFITDAFIELSKRAGARGDKVVVKLLFDTGNIGQVKRYGAESIDLALIHAY